VETKAIIGCKGHSGFDHGSGIIRRSRFATASVHDSQERDKYIVRDEQAIFGDKGYAAPPSNGNAVQRVLLRYT